MIGCTAGGLVLELGYLEPLVALDPATGSEVWSLDQYGPHAIEGDRVISVRFQELREIDGPTGQVRRSLVASLELLHTVAVHGDAIAVATRGARVQHLPRTATAWPARRGSGHDEDVLGVSFAGARFATAGFDPRVVAWERGRSEPIVEVRPRTTEGVWPGHAVHLAGDALFTTFARGVQRWSVRGGALCASIERLKDDVTVVFPLPEHRLVIAASEATRRTHGELYFLDLETLAIVHEVRLEKTCRRARRLDPDRVELTGALGRLVVDAGRRAIVERDTSRPRT